MLAQRGPGICQLVGRIHRDVAKRAPHALEGRCVRVKDDHTPIDVAVGDKDLVGLAMDKHIGGRIQVLRIVVSRA